MLRSSVSRHLARRRAHRGVNRTFVSMALRALHVAYIYIRYGFFYRMVQTTMTITSLQYI